MHSILVVTDYPLLTEGIISVLERDPLLCVDQASAVGEAVERAEVRRPDVVISQPRLADGSVLDLLRGLHNADVDCPVILISPEDEADLFLVALSEGARGFLGRDADAERLLRSVSDVLEGRLVLDSLADRLASEYVSRSSRTRAVPRAQNCVTARELGVLRLLAKGMTNGAISRELFVSESTVRSHVRSIALKLDAENRVQAVARAVNLGLLTPSRSHAYANLDLSRPSARTAPA